MIVERIDKFSKSPTRTDGYHRNTFKDCEAVRILMVAEAGTKVRIIEESKYAARRSVGGVRQFLLSRGVKVRSQQWDNIAEIEKL